MSFGTSLNAHHSVGGYGVKKTVGFETLPGLFFRAVRRRFRRMSLSWGYVLSTRLRPPHFTDMAAWILSLVGAGAVGFYLGRGTAPPTVEVVRVVDTLKVRDTVFLSWGATLGAYRCDSVRFEGGGVFTQGLSVGKGAGLHVTASEWPRWTIWGGVGYTWRVGIRPYVGVWWWWRPYLGLGVYAVPTRPYAVGVGLGVRF